MTPDSDPLDTLALRARGGDAQALALLYRHLAPPLLEYLTRVLGQRADAEDTLHETFLRIFQGRGRYSGRGRFRAWLFTVATRLAFDRLRVSRRREQLVRLAADDAPADHDRDPLEKLMQQELLHRVDAALADLPPTYAVAFHLRVREGFSYQEIASMCDEPEGTLRSRVHHTLKRIRLSLQQDAQHPAERSRQEGNNP